MKSKLEICHKIRTLARLFNFINNKTYVKVIFVKNYYYTIKYEDLSSSSL